MRRETILLLGACLVVGAGAPGWGQNPKITLTLKEATLGEAAAALSKASGVSLQAQRAFGGNPRGPVGNLPRGSFTWSEAPLARAMRDLCSHFKMTPHSVGGGYVFTPEDPNPGKPGPIPPPAWTGNGMRLQVQQIRVNRSRQLSNQPSAPHQFFSDSVSFTIGAELGEGDAARVLGMANVVAADDRGNILGPVHAPRQDRFAFGGFGRNRFPDEWSGSVGLPLPDPAARRLKWLEGELRAFEEVVAFDVEVAVPPAGEVVRRDVAPGSVLLVQRVPPTPVLAVADDEPPDLPLRPAPQQELISPNEQIQVRFYSRGEVPMMAALARTRTGPDAFRALARDGTEPPSFGSSMSTGSAGNESWRRTEFTRTFRIGAPIVRVIVPFVRRSGHTTLARFRIENIPLPELEQERAAVRPLEASPFRGEMLVPEHPFFRRDGALLTCRVTGRPGVPVGGTVVFGLSAPLGREWGPVRWVEAPVDNDGVARLPDLEPGRYRVVRMYLAGLPFGAAPDTPWPALARLTTPGTAIVVDLKMSVTTDLPALQLADGSAPTRPSNPAPRSSRPVRNERNP